MTSLEEQIIKTVSKYKGHESARTYKEFTKMINSLGYPVSERGFRDIVADLVKRKIALIGSNQSEGYFWVETEEDLQIAKASLMCYIKPIVERVNGLETLYAEQHGGAIQGAMI